ncbi:MAG: TVP38/TMEM64 family protein [Rubrobacteraceae bacterium]|nr:TVP38/TMEM64 family protein [Rubrobacteraceae bacterium]
MRPEVKPHEPAAKRPPFVRRHGRRLTALFLWCGLLGGYYWYAWQHGVSPLEAVQRLVELMTSSTLGPLVYVALYAARPLVLFPASLLTLAAGFVFGPVLGTLLVILGSNISASIAYVVGRYFGGRLLDSERATGMTRRYTERLRENGFESVLMMRLVYAPYDLVNYLAGSLKIRWTPFILATVLGSLPGTLSFVLFGASVEGDFTGEMPRLHPLLLLTSALIFAGSLLLSMYLKRRARGDTTSSREK